MLPTVDKVGTPSPRKLLIDPELANAPPVVNIVAMPLPRKLATDPELAHAPPAVNGRRHAAATEDEDPELAHAPPAVNVVATPPP